MTPQAMNELGRWLLKVAPFLPSYRKAEAEYWAKVLRDFEREALQADRNANPQDYEV